MSSNIRPSSAQAWSSNLAQISSREMEADAVVELANSMIEGINCSAKEAKQNLRDLQVALGVNSHDTFSETASKIETLIGQAEALKGKEVIFKEGKIVDKKNSNIIIVQPHNDDIEINEPPPVVQEEINEGANPEAAPALSASDQQTKCFQKIRGKKVSVEDIHAFVQSVEVSNKDTKQQLAVASKELKALQSQRNLTDDEQETLNNDILGVEFLQASVGFYEKMSKKYGKECVKEFFLRENLRNQRTAAKSARGESGFSEKQLRGDIFRAIETQCKDKAATWKATKQTNDATLKALEKQYGLASVNAGLASYPSKEERPAVRRGEKSIDAKTLEEQIQAQDKEIVEKVFNEVSDGDLTFMAYNKEISVGKKVLQSMKLWDKAVAGKLTPTEIKKAKTQYSQCTANIDIHVNGINNFLGNINHPGTITQKDVLEIAYAAGQGKLVMKLLRKERFTKSEAQMFFKEVAYHFADKLQPSGVLVSPTQNKFNTLYTDMNNGYYPLGGKLRHTRCSTIGELERAYHALLPVQQRALNHHLKEIRGYLKEQGDKDKVTEEVFNQAVEKLQEEHDQEYALIQTKINNNQKLTRTEYDLIAVQVEAILHPAPNYADYGNL